MLPILRSWRAINIYIDALERFGIDSKQHDGNIASRVCSAVFTALDEQGKLDNGVFEWEIRRAASLVALCILGPTEYRQFKGEQQKITNEMIEFAAREFSRGREAAQTLDLKTIFTVATAGLMHRSFAVLFCKALSEQN